MLSMTICMKNHKLKFNHMNSEKKMLIGLSIVVEYLVHLSEIVFIRYYNHKKHNEEEILTLITKCLKQICT